MTKSEAGVCEIDNFLLSCRVIGRTVETAFLAILTETARAAGVLKMVGRFFPTKKNAPATNFFASHGFAQTGEQEGASEWTLDLPSTSLTFPPWIERAG